MPPLFFWLFATLIGQAALEIQRLKVESLTSPLGLYEAAPRLSWELSSPVRGARQSAYQIRIATEKSHLTSNQSLLCDSGRVESSGTIQIPYADPTLLSNQHVWWQVRVWDETGKMTASPLSEWSMGLLKPEDWGAEWIGISGPATEFGSFPTTARWVSQDRTLPARLLRRDFNSETPIKRATLHIIGVGYHEVFLNGEKISDHVLAPGITDYSKRPPIVTHDVTTNIQTGANTLGIHLGNGRYYAPRIQVLAPTISSGWPVAKAHLIIDYRDGTSRSIVTDSSLQASDEGPIRATSRLARRPHHRDLPLRRCSFLYQIPRRDPCLTATGWQCLRCSSRPLANLLRLRRLAIDPDCAARNTLSEIS